MNTTSKITTLFKFNALLLCIVNIFFTLAGICLNSVVIISLLSSQLRRKLCYFTILILACFDIAVVIVFHPLITFETMYSWLFATFTENIKVLYFTHLFAMSLSALSTMTMERYLALVYPFLHERFVTKSTLIAAFALFQLPFGVLNILRLDNSNDYIELAILLAFMGVAFLVIFCLNFKLYYMAKALRKRIVIPLGSLNGQEHTNITIKPKISRVTLQRISTCLLAVGCLFLCYTPTIATIGLRMALQEGLSQQTWRIIDLWELTFASLNSSFNCLIFFYKNSALRQHGAKIIRKFFCLKSENFYW